MSKDLECRWNFVVRNDASMNQGREDSSLSFFFANKLRCLVREYIQNSLDAHNPELPNDPVIVEFSYDTLECSQYPQLILSLLERLKSCSEMCRSIENGKDPYFEKYDYLNERINWNSIGFLKVSDYNTLGMPYNPEKFKPSKFKSCVRSSSSSFKDSEHALGSHGLGKTVGFVNSGINAVYYSTRTTDGKTYGEGVIKLCDHLFKDEDDELQLYENVAFYDSKKGTCPDSDECIPEVFLRKDEAGTDAYVLGMEYSEVDIKVMRKEILRSFFKAIKENKLLVKVCGVEISSDNIENIINEYYQEEGELDTKRTRTPELLFNPRPYYKEVLCNQNVDENHCVFSTEDSSLGQFEALGHATLYAWKSDTIRQANSRDSIVYMRDNNMVVEVKRGRNNKGYYGLFLCDGEGSKYLRRMENVTHDKWDLGELRGESKEYRKQADKVLHEIESFILACEKQMFPEQESEERTIASLRNRRVSVLGNNKQEDDEDSIWPSTNITERIKATKPNGRSSILETLPGKRKKKKAKGKPTTVETNVGPSMSPVDPEPPTPTPPTPPTPPPPVPPIPPTPTPPSGIPETPDGPVVSGEGNVEGNSAEIEDTGIRMREIKLDGRSRHLIPLHDGEFACKLVLTVPREFENCRIELFVQGVTGQIPLSLSRVSDGCKIGGVDSNEIIGFNLTPGNNSIKFTPVERVKNYTLIIKAYGN